MRKIFICSIFLLVGSFVQSQVKQSNATWEETVNFITENKNCIKDLVLSGYQLEASPINEINVDSNQIHIYYDHTFETLKYDYVWKMRDVGNLHIPLRHLQRASVEDAYLYLELVDEYATHENKQYLWSPSGNGYLYDLNSGTKKTDFIAFSICDSEMSFQFRKALIHLSYLANRERKKKNDSQ